jgi:nucleoid DNA-binding protein/cell division septation protein DedD
MNITASIKDLLLQRETLILPGFGEFRTIGRKPSVQPDGSITPPGKTVSFNPAIKANDYVLARFIADRENISVSKGNELIRSFVIEISEELNTQKSLVLEEIGRFSLDQFNSLSFMPDPLSNFDLSTFGLGPVKPPPAPTLQNQEKTESDDTTVQTSETLSEKPSAGKRRRIWLSIVIILLCAAVILAILYKDVFMQTWNSFSEKFQSAMKHQPEPVTEPPVIQPDHQQKTEAQPATEQEVQNPETETRAVETPLPDSNDGSFIIVSGCFKEEANALKMVNKLKSNGFPLAAIEGKTGSGLFKVSAGSYETESEAKSALQTARSQNLLTNAWVAKR